MNEILPSEWNKRHQHAHTHAMTLWTFWTSQLIKTAVTKYSRLQSIKNYKHFKILLQAQSKTRQKETDNKCKNPLFGFIFTIL